MGRRKDLNMYFTDPSGKKAKLKVNEKIVNI